MSEQGSGSRENRLGKESSPYLRLHRHNPVDWYPWGEEALDRARREDKPIFLSVGYSTCYWCHVMERESFSDPAIAERMNRAFVNVKLDREERPDLDEIYMAATQILTGQGGWPNSVFLTPDLAPFFAGTYFPPVRRHGRPGFAEVVASLDAAWRTRRDDVEEQARSLREGLRSYLEESASPGTEPPAPQVAERSLADLENRFDRQYGGFGSAPKFPTPGNLFLLAELAEEFPSADEMLTVTLDRMARGGIYDQLGGGFHRYATDAQWKIPHFEKMLYDNGFLVEIYARQAARRDDPEMGRIAREIGAYLAREMTAPGGAFYSAQDAETDGREGAFYAWTREELQAELGDEELGFLAGIFGFDRPPFFEGSHYVLHLPEPLEAQGKRRRLSRDQLLEQLAPLRESLREARERRPRPATDDKILTDWNGIAIAGLAAAGRLLGEESMIRQAAAAADFLLAELWPEDGPLLHTWRGGQAKIPALLGDYVHLVRGCLALERATGEARWLEAARRLSLEQEARLGDPRGGFFGAARAADLLFRSKEVFDGAIPGANAVAVWNLLALGERTGEARFREAAQLALSFFGPLVERVPEAARSMALAARRLAGDRPGAGGGTAPAPEERPADDPVTVALELGAPAQDGWRPLQLRLEVAPGWHIYGAAADPGKSHPLSIAAEGAELEELSLPPAAEREPAPGAPVPVYEGSVSIAARVRWAGEASAGLVLSYQACDARRCLRPVSRKLVLGEAPRGGRRGARRG